MRVVLIVAKQLALAKTRLGPALAAGERAMLAEAMFRDVLAAALSSRIPDRVVVVTSDASLLRIAREAGAGAIDEQFPRGLNAAVALATKELAARGAGTVCTVLSDIPLITGEDIDAVLEAAADRRGVVLVPSRDLTGTNVIARSPADVIPTRFGRSSLMHHLEYCRKGGIGVQVLRLARPALDLDLVEDLAEYARVASTTHTLNQLARLGIAQY
ncbi:MAG TPA: 2-phospho-L-lactate guanylyltransferase [Candidatus Binataceae bacterium]|nr:2-phospho-L-lactate guanylyltransferase [Candidatus Binataceae bacterium]